MPHCNAVISVESILLRIGVVGRRVTKKAKSQGRFCTLPPATAVQCTQEIVHQIAEGGKGRGRERYAGWGGMHNALGTLLSAVLAVVVWFTACTAAVSSKSVISLKTIQQEHSPSDAYRGRP